MPTKPAPYDVFMDSFKSAGHKPALMENARGWSRVSCWHCDEHFIWYHSNPTGWYQEDEDA